MGISMIVMGIATFVLPMVGMQFNFMQLFGRENQPVVGAVLIVVGLLAAIGEAAAAGRQNQTDTDY